MTPGKEHTMPEQYIDLAAIAELAGVGRESIKTYHKRATANRAAGNPRPGDLPAEDIRLGRTPGWKPRTIQKWLDSRPRASAAVREQLTADAAAMTTASRS